MWYSEDYLGEPNDLLIEDCEMWVITDYAVEYELIDKNYARDITLSIAERKSMVEKREHHIPYTDEEMEKLWNDGTWNEQTLKDLRKAHYRTPYAE